jgi:NitT/TauT family transport system permease protein
MLQKNDTEEGPEQGALASRLATYAYPAGTALALFLAWEAFVRFSGISALLLPAPSEVLVTVVQQFPVLLHMSAITSVEFLLGFGLSVLIGLPLGALIVYARPIELAVYPLLVAFQTLP